jgi:hypothetical protein
MICIEEVVIAPNAANISPVSSALFTNKAGIEKRPFIIIKRGRRIYILQFNLNVGKMHGKSLLAGPTS